MDEQNPFVTPEESQVEETSNVIPIQGDGEQAQEASPEPETTSPIDQFKNEDGTLDVDKLTESYTQLNEHLSQTNTALADFRARQQLAEQQAIQQQQYLQQQQQQPNTPNTCLLYTSPSPRDRQKSRMPSSA